MPARLDDTKNLRWRTELVSGHSTPLVVGELVVVTGFDGSNRRLSVVALRLADGLKQWEWTQPVPAVETYHRTTGGAAQPSPASDGERIFVFFGSFGLVCLDLKGQPVWSQPMGPFQDEYGAGSSPVLIGDSVIVQQDHDVDSFLAAFDRRTGRQIWRTARPHAVRSYSSPAIWEQGGKRELLVAGALELASYDPQTGDRLWWVRGLARIVIPVPVVSGGAIYMASWAPGGDAGRRIQLEDWSSASGRWDKNGDGVLSKSEVESPEVLDRFFRVDMDQNGVLDREEWERHAAIFKSARNSVLALRPSAARGELPEADVVWSYTRGVPYVASPVVDRGILWMVKDGGIVTKLALEEGRLLQEERLPGPGSYYASPLSADGKIYFASEQGVVSVVTNLPDWQVLGFRDFKEKIYASPVAVQNGLLIRTDRGLYRFDGARN